MTETFPRHAEVLFVEDPCETLDASSRLNRTALLKQLEFHIHQRWPDYRKHTLIAVNEIHPGWLCFMVDFFADATYGAVPLAELDATE